MSTRCEECNRPLNEYDVSHGYRTCAYCALVQDDKLVAYCDDAGERFGTGPEMIAEIKRLRDALREEKCRSIRLMLGVTGD